VAAAKESGIWDLLLKEEGWITKATVLIEVAKEAPSFAAMFSDLLVCQSVLKDGLGDHFYTSAFVEEEAGSDLSKVETEARLEQGNWILSGEKWFVANAELADAFLVLAKTKDDSYSIYNVPKNADGVIIQEQKKMGLEGYKLSKVILNNVSVPQDSTILSLGQNFEGLQHAGLQEKLAISSLSIGIAESALDESIERARTRKQFGQPIGDFQAIQFKIAEMTVGINGAKTLLYQAAQKHDNQEDAATEAAMAKVFSSEVSGKAVDHAVQIFGSHGLLNDSKVSKLYRSQRLTEIFGQTSEMQRMAIAEYVIKNIGINQKEVNYGLSI
jgi:alkylation response protein AidB-like acyl-CoA dehydrogenase